MKNRLTKFLAIFMSVLMLLTSMVFIGCASDPNTPGANNGGNNGSTSGGNNGGSGTPTDTDPVNSSAMGYLEDFGCEVITNAVLKDQYIGQNSVGHEDNHYRPIEVTLTPRIFFSHLTAPAGKYSAKIADQDLGQVTLDASGEITIDELPEGLVLGEKYTLTLTNAVGKPYNQTVRLVSRAIDNGDEVMRALTYYKRQYEKHIGVFNGSSVYNTEKPAETTNPGKYYNGETFSRRLYVMTDDIVVDKDKSRYGSVMDERPTEYWYRNPFCNLWNQGYNYFYDEFDGNGYSLVVDNIVSPAFGHIGQTAKIYDLQLGSNTTWWNQYAAVDKGLFSLSIADNAYIDSIAIFPQLTCTLAGMVGLSGRIYPNAQISNIYIYLPDSIKIARDGDSYTSAGVTYYHNREANMRRSGLLACELMNAYDIETDELNMVEVTNVVIVCSGIEHAGFVHIIDEDGDAILTKVGGENTDFEYVVKNCFTFTAPYEARNSGKNKVGNWLIKEGGNADFIPKHD